jgi:agmatine/peptidylarginine deiminase
MGSTYEVYIWKYGRDEQYHTCEDLMEALEAMIKAKDENYKYIRLEWRPKG